MYFSLNEIISYYYTMISSDGKRNENGEFIEVDAKVSVLPSHISSKFTL